MTTENRKYSVKVSLNEFNELAYFEKSAAKNDSNSFSLDRKELEHGQFNMKRFFEGKTVTKELLATINGAREGKDAQTAAINIAKEFMKPENISSLTIEYFQVGTASRGGRHKEIVPMLGFSQSQIKKVMAVLQDRLPEIIPDEIKPQLEPFKRQVPGKAGAFTSM